MSYEKEFVPEFLNKNLKVVGKPTNEGEAVIVNKDTGEYEQIISKTYKKMFVDNESFTKVFKNMIKLSEASIDMSKMSFRIIFWVIENMPKNSNKIVLNPKELKEVLKGKSLAKIYEAIKELLDKDIVRLVQGYLYEVNPSFLFNGNRVEFVSTIVTEYAGKDGWKITEYKEMKAKKDNNIVKEKPIKYGSNK